MHFRGRYVWMNGDVYEGEWKRGLRDGCREVKLNQENSK